jgi:GAF domain-containing protein
VETSDVRRPRSGLGTVIGALAAARTGTDIVDALRAGRAEACGASAIGLVLADPDPRLLPGSAGPPLVLDPLLVTEFACSPVSLVFGSAVTLLDTYPILGTVGALAPGAACASVPLSGPGTPTGALVAVWDHPRVFSPGDRGLLGALAGLASAELARTWPLDRERDALEQLRRRMRPSWLPRITGAEVAVRHQPSGPGDARRGV